MVGSSEEELRSVGRNAGIQHLYDQSESCQQAAPASRGRRCSCRTRLPQEDGTRHDRVEDVWAAHLYRALRSGRREARATAVFRPLGVRGQPERGCSRLCRRFPGRDPLRLPRQCSPANERRQGDHCVPSQPDEGARRWRDRRTHSNSCIAIVIFVRTIAAPRRTEAGSAHRCPPPGYGNSHSSRRLPRTGGVDARQHIDGLGPQPPG
mmetsp:Transcript_31363/g.51894  ORF Transcript_31363/g.51894 Transcript_31363/m.51894 type:complete len:208 (-) Transcript_31363:447-1070(-)